MLALLFLACGVVVEGTDVKFTPGPGLKKNEDGSYSRSLNKEYLESVAAGEDQIPEPGSSLRNLGITIILAGAVFLYANRHAVVDAATKIKPPSTAAAPKKLSEAEIVRT